MDSTRAQSVVIVDRARFAAFQPDLSRASGEGSNLNQKPNGARSRQQARDPCVCGGVGHGPRSLVPAGLNSRAVEESNYPMLNRVSP